MLRFCNALPGVSRYDEKPEVVTGWIAREMYDGVDHGCCVTSSSAPLLPECTGLLVRETVCEGMRARAVLRVREKEGGVGGKGRAGGFVISQTLTAALLFSVSGARDLIPPVSSEA